MTREEKETLLNEYCRKRSCGGCPFMCGPSCTRTRLMSDDIDEAMRLAGLVTKANYYSGGVIIETNTVYKEEEKKVFTKKDLKNGDVLYMDDGHCLTYFSLSENLTHPRYGSRVNKVFRDGNLIYDREAEEKPVELTVSEIADRLGIKNLKIVK